MSNETTTRPGTGIVGPVRLSYMNVFKPRINELKGGVPEYSVVLLIPKKPNDFCPNPKGVWAHLQNLVGAALAEKFAGKTPPKWTSCLKDGDIELNGEGEPKNPGYLFLNCSCSNEYPPLLIDGERSKVREGWQSGDWGMVKLRFYGYDHASGKRGVGCGLLAIQFLRHDEPLGGGTTSPDEFETRQSDPPLSSSGQIDGSEYDPFADE